MTHLPAAQMLQMAMKLTQIKWKVGAFLCIFERSACLFLI